MLRLLRQDNPFALLAVIIAALVIRLPLLPEAPAFEAMAGNGLYGPILNGAAFFFGNGAGLTTLALLQIIGQAIYLNRVALRKKLYPHTGYVPAFVYILLTSLHPSWLSFSPSLVCIWPALGILDVLSRLQQPTSPRKAIYNGAFLAGLAGVIWPPGFILCIWFFVSLALLRAFHPSEWMVGVMGLLTPFYFYESIRFLTDQPFFLPSVVDLRFHLLPNLKHLNNSVLLCGVLVAMLVALLNLQWSTGTISLSLRRFWGALLVGLMFSLGAGLIGLSFKLGPASWLLAAPLLSLLISLPLTGSKTTRWSTFALCLILALAIFEVAYRQF